MGFLLVLTRWFFLGSNLSFISVSRQIKMKFFAGQFKLNLNSDDFSFNEEITKPSRRGLLLLVISFAEYKLFFFVESGPQLKHKSTSVKTSFRMGPSGMLNLYGSH